MLHNLQRFKASDTFLQEPLEGKIWPSFQSYPQNYALGLIANIVTYGCEYKYQKFNFSILIVTIQINSNLSNAQRYDSRWNYTLDTTNLEKTN